MRTRTLILIAATLAAGACKREATTAPANAANAANAPTGTSGTSMVPEHGGAVATSGGLVTEIVTQPDGKLLAYVRSPQGPVQDANVRVTVRNADGTSKPVVVAWDAQSSAYVGYVWGIEPGMKTVDVTVPGVAANAPPQTVSSQVTVSAVAHPPAARYGGSVEIIGQYAVEIVPSRTGDVAFFVMDMQGNPMPDANIDLPRVAIDTNASGSIAGGTVTGSVGGSIAIGGTVNAGANGAIAPPTEAPGAAAIAPPPNGAVAIGVPSAPLGTAVVVPVQRQGDHWVAHVDGMGNMASVGFNVDLSVGGHVYSKAAVPSAPVIVALPPSIALPSRGTAVVVAPAAQGGTVVVAPPQLGVAVPVGANPGLGTAVVVAPPQGGAVVVGGVNPGLGVAVPVNPGGPVAGARLPVGVGIRVNAPAVAVPAGGIVAAPPSVRINGGPSTAGIVVNGPAAPGVVIAPPGPGGRVLVAPPGPPHAGVIVSAPTPVAGVVMNGPSPSRAGIVIAPPAPAGGVVFQPPPRPVIMAPPGPPVPPTVNVQGGFQVGGSVNIR